MKIHAKFAIFIRFLLLLDFVFARFNGIKKYKNAFFCCYFSGASLGIIFIGKCNRRKLFMNELFKLEKENGEWKNCVMTIHDEK